MAYFKSNSNHIKIISAASVNKCSETKMVQPFLKCSILNHKRVKMFYGVLIKYG
jgi:hypothetical protein